MIDSFTNAIRESLIETHPGIQAVILKGSRTQEGDIDFWSDYDIIAVLRENETPSEELLCESLWRVGALRGTESFIDGEQVLYRTIVDFRGKIHLLDISLCTAGRWAAEGSTDSSEVIFGDIDWPPEKGSGKSDITLESYRDNIESTWFKFFQTVKKISRDDNLIGFHLLFDLLREILVIKMILRDIEWGTPVHRFGMGEELPEIFSGIAGSADKSEILDYIDRVAREYDSLLRENLDDYESRYDTVSTYIRESKAKGDRNESE